MRKDLNDMDNNVFENNMINTVNDNARAVSAEMDAQFYEEALKWIERRKEKRTRAIIETICWVLCFVTIVAALCVLAWLSAMPTILSIVISSVFGIATGVRVCGLVNVI